MDVWPLFAAGMLLIALAVFDMLWTVVATARGAGPFTRVLTRGLWRLGANRARGRHTLLEFLGYASLVGVVLAWVAAMWGGLTLAFLADSAAVLDASSQQPASAVARAGYAMGGLAGAGAAYVAGSGGWVLLNNAASVLGLALVTLTLAYLFQVVTATLHKRALALRIFGIAETPAEMANLGLGQRQLGALGSHLVSLSEDVAQLARSNLVLPVLNYMHVGKRNAAIEVALAVLDDALTIVEGAEPRDSRGITGPVRLAIDEFLDTAPIDGAHSQDPPMPQLACVVSAEAGAPDQQCFRDAFARQRRRRVRLEALLEQNGWQWQDVDPTAAHS